MKTRVEESLPKKLVTLHAVGLLRDVDLYLAEVVNRLFGVNDRQRELILILTALTSRAVGDGHICLDLTKLDQEWMLSLVSTDPGRDVLALIDETIALCAGASSAAGLFESLDTGGALCPLVQEGSRVYLRRYYEYEQRVATQLVARARGSSEAGPLTGELAKRVDELLDSPEARAAACAALTRTLAIITGGPGTGKTYTAARILALLGMQSNAKPVTLEVRMAAPTGKAAARMDESLRKARLQLGRAGINMPDFENACTIERLLGYRSESPYFRHDASNPLSADVVLIDEASMVDLAKMAKLLDALKPQTRLVLLGDMHQLSSVGPGSVLGDICESKVLESSRVTLVKSRRFPADSAVGRTSAAINSSDDQAGAEMAWNELVNVSRESITIDGDQASVGLTDKPPAWLEQNGKVDDALRKSIVEGYGPFLEAKTPQQAFDALARFRILCPTRRGPYGVQTVNRLVEKVLSFSDGKAAGASDALWNSRLHLSDTFYRGRVIMVTENHYSLGLFNGDMGIVLPRHEDGDELVAWFEPTAHDEAEEDGEPKDNHAWGYGFRPLPCQLLPAHETGFALTVHKSQGSEFGHVLLLVAPNGSGRVLTRELIYTAITRTQHKAQIWCSHAAFVDAVSRRVQRFGGLQQTLVHVVDAGASPRPYRLPDVAKFC